ncbi:MAG: HEAT repeat domain-containing protein, partial [Planctomycetota bacterium]
MVRNLIAVSVVIAVLAGAAVSAVAQDKTAWQQAAQRVMDAKGALRAERVAAVTALGDATYSDVDERTAKVILEFLGSELSRSNRGQSEEMVSQAVLDACTEALKKIQNPKAVKYMIKAAPKGADARFGYHIIKALVGSSSGDFHEDLVKLVDHTNPLIQEAAVEALIEEGKASSLDIFIRVIGDVSKSFEVKIAALQGVRSHLKADDDANISKLLDAMGKLPDGQRRVAAEIRDFLNGLLGMNEQSYDPNAWRTAIAQKKAGGGGAPGVGGGAPGVGGGGGGAPASGHKTVAEFFGIKTDSTRIVFCLDRTGSMADPCSDKKKEEKEK